MSAIYYQQGHKKMKSKEIAKLTGYAEITVTKYAGKLGIPYTGEGLRKTYHWSDQDIPRLREAIQGPHGRRDRRGGRPKTVRK